MFNWSHPIGIIVVHGIGAATEKPSYNTENDRNNKEHYEATRLHKAENLDENATRNVR